MTKACIVSHMAAPSAREKVLDAYEAILIEHGERAATLEQVASRAGVSKGGLLYHFRDKAALAEGLLDRLSGLAAEDVELMAAAPDGPSAYYLRTSVFEDSPLDHSIIAATRLDSLPADRRRQALSRVQGRWLELIEAEVRDPAIARAILLMGDGLYYNASLGAQDEQAQEHIDELLRVVEQLKGLA